MRSGSGSVGTGKPRALSRDSSKNSFSYNRRLNRMAERYTAEILGEGHVEKIEARILADQRINAANAAFDVMQSLNTVASVDGVPAASSSRIGV